MNRDTQRAKAEAFRAMHDRSRILVLPNAWDAMSARVIEEAGARAIATTSAGVAFSVGYPDGEAIPRDEMIAAIARIARVVTVPVSADIESGFAHDARELAETVRRVIDAGAVGINLEDQVHDGTPSPLRFGRRRRARSRRARGGRLHRRPARHQRAHRRVSARNRRARHAFRTRCSPRERIPQGRRRLSVHPGGLPPRRHRANRAGARRPAQFARVPRHSD